MKITDVRTVLLTCPYSAAFVEIHTDKGVIGLGIRLTDEIKNRYPFVPGSGEFNSVD